MFAYQMHHQDTMGVLLDRFCGGHGMRMEVGEEAVPISMVAYAITWDEKAALSFVYEVNGSQRYTPISRCTEGESLVFSVRPL